MHLPGGVTDLWTDVDAAIARTIGSASRAWERLFVLLRHFLEQWDSDAYERWSAGADVHARFGWMCAAPGCTSRRHLEAHHVEYRSRGGSDDAPNLVSLCTGHHRVGVHGGAGVCVSGRAPDGLEWELPLFRSTGDVLRDAPAIGLTYLRAPVLVGASARRTA